MQLTSESGWFYVTLTPEETDRFFDPFDPMDHEMPSHLHRARHRYIKEDIYAWLVENFGEVGVWMTHPDLCPVTHQPIRCFEFSDQNHAVLFTTMWAGMPLGEPT
jgi:hypothetical protein